MSLIKLFRKTIEEGHGVITGELKIADVPFNIELRALCESNACGNYNKNHMCPPLVGGPDFLIAGAKQYSDVIVFSKVFTLEDSYDYDGMLNGQKAFKADFYEIAVLAESVFSKPLILGVGGCELCEDCSAKNGLPCRTPIKAYASLEAYCIQVSELARLSGLDYINGTNTVTYFGSVFVKSER